MHLFHKYFAVRLTLRCAITVGALTVFTACDGGTAPRTDFDVDLFRGSPPTDGLQAVIHDAEAQANVKLYGSFNAEGKPLNTKSISINRPGNDTTTTISVDPSGVLNISQKTTAGVLIPVVTQVEGVANDALYLRVFQYDWDRNSAIPIVRSRLIVAGSKGLLEYLNPSPAKPAVDMMGEPASLQSTMAANTGALINGALSSNDDEPFGNLGELITGPSTLTRTTRFFGRTFVTTGLAVLLGVVTAPQWVGAALLISGGALLFPDIARSVVSRFVEEIVPSAGAVEYAPPSSEPTPVTPRGVPSSCGGEGSMRSISGDTPLNINFINRTAGSVSVFWLNYTGQRVFYNNIGAGSTLIEPSWLTHPWVVTNSQGQCLGLWMAGSTAVIQ